jgi:hypothetical protein
MNRKSALENSMSGARIITMLAWLAALSWSGCTEPGETAEPTFPGVPGCTGSCATAAGQGQTPVDGGLLPLVPSADAGPFTAPQAAPDAGSPLPAGALPCDIAKIVSARCGTCHKDPPAFSAPMPLATQAQFHAAGRSVASAKVHELVKARINLKSGSALMPPASSPPLTAAELATLNAWLDQGAPPGNTVCNEPPASGGGEQSIDTSGLDCFKFLAHADGDKNNKFKVGVAVDKYYNMAFRAPWQGTVYGQVMRPIIDNTNAIHHWLLYQEDGADGSVTETIGQHAGGQLITGWAPGGTPVDFRKHGDVGFELPPTSYVVEFHYNSSDPNALDASGVEVCVQKTAPQHVAGMSWLGYDNWVIAGDLGGPRNSWVGTCEPQSSEPIHILFVTPHMHKAGVRMRSIINGNAGQRVLHDKPFDFAYQVTYETSEVLMPGETITTTCEFSEPKSMGQATSDEMCYLFTYAYPKDALVDNGLFGTFQHGSGVCLGQ